MALYWTIATWVYLLSSIPTILGGAACLRKFHLLKYPHLALIALGWIFTGVSYMCEAMANLYRSTGYFRAEHVLIALGGIFIVLTLDYISRGSASSPRLVIATNMSMAIIITAVFDNNAVKELEASNRDKIFDTQGFFALEITVFTIWIGMQFVYYTFLLYKVSPPEVKGIANMNFIGGIFAGIICPFAAALGLDKSLYPGLDAVFFSIGVSLIAYAFWREPKLGFILPFRAHRLIVVHTKMGIPLFTFTWNTRLDLGDEFLFTGMIQGLSSIVKESVNRGEVKQVILERAHLIIERSDEYPVACVLVSTRYSTILDHSLKNFTAWFVKEYADKFNNPHQINQFAAASAMIPKFFPFVPEYH